MINQLLSLGLFMIIIQIQYLNTNCDIIELNLNKITKRRLHFNNNFNYTNMKNVTNNTFLKENSIDNRETNISSNIDLKKNENSNLYTINLEIGSNKDKFTILIDSGSNLLWIPSEKCLQCSDRIKKFNTTNSSTFTNLSEYHEIFYHDGAFSKGYFSKDEIKIGEFFTNITFLLSYLINNEIIGIDGILGLGPNNDSNSSIINMLYANNKINKKMYTQYFISSNDTGKLIIGDYPAEIYRNLENYTYCNIPQDSPHSNQWVCVMEKSFIGFDYNLNKTVDVKKEVIFDSGTNVLIFDTSYEEYFLKNFFGKLIKYCLKKNENYFCHPKVETMLPPLFFNFNGWTYKIDAKNLFYKSEKNNYLQLMVEFNNTEIWNFGLPFLNNYYVVYNYEDNLVGFYGGNRYNATTFFIEKIRHDNKDIIYYAAIFIILVLFAYSVVSLIKYFRKRKKSNTVFKF
jgi:hypothetical protein